MDIGFLNRLHALQSICDSSQDVDAPCALLIVSGADGKNNKGALSVLKYLFFGAVGKELYDDSGFEAMDDLDELVLLIQHTAVSVLWREGARKKLYALLSQTPLLVEYRTSVADEEDVSLSCVIACWKAELCIIACICINLGGRLSDEEMS